MTVNRMSLLPTSKVGKRQEAGYSLAGVMVLLAVFMILMAIALPKIRKDIRRDQELETIQRGQQYIRAVQLYYRHFHQYPNSVEALEDTDGIRFLRRRYPDPLTGQDDWKPVLLGQNHAPLAMGFFGKVLDMGAAVPGSTRKDGANGILGTPPATAYDPVSNSSSNGASEDDGQTQSTNGGQSPLASQILGGAGIIGFSPPVAKPAILVYKTKTYYDEWEFVYDPAVDRNVKAWWLVPGNGRSPNTGAPGMPPTSATQ